MDRPQPLDCICSLLTDRYDALGREAAHRLREWVSGCMPYAHPEILEKHLTEDRVDLLFDAFWQVLPFGTGGRRGPVGYGSNRMNPTTLAMTVQGHCNYLRSAFPDGDDLAVVVANDVRVFNDARGVYRFLDGDHPLLGVSARSLARLACEVYAANGIVAYFSKPEDEMAVMTTPMLSYLINELEAVGGVNVSASHNHPDDNGIKVYDEFGSQPIAPKDQLLVDTMARAREVKSMPFGEACQEGLIRSVPEERYVRYFDTYMGIFGGVYEPQPGDPPVVYTPLCGCGLTTAGEVLARLKFVPRVPPDQGPDGTFGVIPLLAPNPEVPQSSEPARAFADQRGSGLVLSSDPDADRIGVEAKLADGSWYHFDGDQAAAIVCYFLMLDPEGPQRRGLVIETSVTTKLLREIAGKAGDSRVIDDLLVGIKYIADVLKALRRDGRYDDVVCSPDELVLAAEESHGMVILPTILDKDSTGPCMYLAALYQMLHRQGRSLLDYYADILDELGEYDSVNRSIMMAGAEGMRRKDKIMSSLREHPPETIGGRRVDRVTDHWDEEMFGPFKSKSDKLPRNVLQLFTDTHIITVRPSGTEPKLKFYCQLLPHGERSSAKGVALFKEVRAKADAVARRIYNELLRYIDLSIDEAALLLPDIVELDSKVAFQQSTVPQLRESLATGRFSRLEDVLGWLRQDVSAMIPGADPLPALKPSLDYLCAEWSRELSGEPLLAELAGWATAR